MSDKVNKEEGVTTKIIASELEIEHEKVLLACVGIQDKVLLQKKHMSGKLVTEGTDQAYYSNMPMPLISAVLVKLGYMDKWNKLMLKLEDKGVLDSCKRDLPLANEQPDQPD